jgi:HlyD family secretion protein
LAYLHLPTFQPPQLTAVATLAPASRAITPTIQAWGRLEPQTQVTVVAAPSSLGTVRIARLLIAEGDRVQAGQLMAVLDMERRLQSAVRKTEAQVRAARTRLAQVQAGAKPGEILAQKAEIDRLKAELEKTKSEYQQFLGLYAEGAIAAANLDQRRLAVQAADQQLRQAQRLLASLSEVRPIDIQRAEAHLAVIVANLQKAEAELDASYVRAPITGQVLRIHTRTGEVVSTEGIAELGTLSKVDVVAEVDATDLGRVQTGQSATVTSDAFSGSLTGTVEQIDSPSDNRDNPNAEVLADPHSRPVEVRIHLDDDTPVFNLGNVQVKVVIVP